MKKKINFIFQQLFSDLFSIFWAWIFQICLHYPIFQIS